MPFTLDALARLRPFLFHLTARENLPRIRRLGRIDSAARLAKLAGREDVLTARRRNHEPIIVDGETVLLRDQAPLHAGNMQLDDGWSFEQFVRHINDRVFFWPGGVAGPISYGVRHFERYADESPAILRVPTAAMFAANPDGTPMFCRYNSGSPRWSRGIAAPRGSSTFVGSADAHFSAAQVVEVTVPGSLILPEGVSVGDTPSGPWVPL